MRRGDSTAIGPGFKIIQSIDDAAAELAVNRAGAKAAVLFQRAVGKPQKARGFRRAQKARWQIGEVGHERGTSRRLAKAVGSERRNGGPPWQRFVARGE